MTGTAADVGIEDPHATGQLQDAPKEVRESLSRLAQALRGDPFRGTFISLRRVPPPTLRRWQSRLGELPNLYRLDLPGGWRALYFVATDERRRSAFVFEVVRHAEYDRMLGY
jgi:hypothetical protein